MEDVECVVTFTSAIDIQTKRWMLFNAIQFLHISPSPAAFFSVCVCQIVQLTPIEWFHSFRILSFVQPAKFELFEPSFTVCVHILYKITREKKTNTHNNNAGRFYLVLFFFTKRSPFFMFMVSGKFDLSPSLS